MDVTPDQRLEIYKRFANGQKPGQIALEMPGTNPQGVGKIVRASGIKRGSGIVPPHLLQVLDFSAPAPAPIPAPMTGPVYVAPPPPTVVHAETPAVPKESTPRQQEPRSPLFPAARENAISYIDIERVAANPHSAGVGHLPKLDPFADEGVIRSRYGGGRYLLTARNSRGEQLFQRASDILGRSLALEGNEEEVIALGQDAGLPVMVPTSANPELAMLIRAQAEDAKRQREQDQARLEAFERRIKDDADQRVKFALEMAEQREKNQGTVFSQMMAQTQEHNRMMMDMMTRNQPKPVDMFEQLKNMKLLKELVMEDVKEETAFEKALGALPGLAAMFMGGVSDNDDEETDSDAQPNPDPKAERPRAPIAPAPHHAVAKAKPIKVVAKDLYDSLVASGVPPEKARTLVGQGLNMLAAQVKPDIERAQAAKIKTTTPVAPAPAPEPVEVVEAAPEAEPLGPGESANGAGQGLPLAPEGPADAPPPVSA